MTIPDGQGPAEIKRALPDLNAQERPVEKAERDRIVPVPRGGRMAITEQQRYMWVLHQLAPDAPTYNLPRALHLRGHLDVAALREVLRRLVARHESLRTRFVSDRGVPYQVVDPAPADWPLPVIDAAGRSLLELATAQVRIPFDLENGPVFRPVLLRAAPDEHMLLLVTHHIAIDGWSHGLLIRELSTLYQAVRSGTTTELPPLPLQPADYAAWQSSWLTGDEARQQVNHLRDVLDGVETLDFPSDRKRPALPTGAGAILEARLPAGIAEAATHLARQYRVSLLTLLYAAFLVVTHRYTGQTDQAVGTIMHGRTRSELEPMVGFFANTVTLRTNVAGNPTFRELVHRCNHAVLDARSNQDVPFSMVVEALKPERVAGRNPLFQICFVMMDGRMASPPALGDLTLQQIPVRGDTARFDLSLQVTKVPDGDHPIWVEYSTELFDRDRIERLVSHFTEVLTAAVADPDATVADLTLAPESELATMFSDWNPTPARRPDALLHELVTRQAARAPDRVAMRFEGTELRYGDLDRRSNRLAHLLAATGVVPGDVVGLLLERGLHLPIAELGVLKTGGAWLALDPQYPAERLAYQLTDAAAVTVLTTSDLADKLPDGISRVLLDTVSLDHHPATPPEVDVRQEDAAYVIYTSGSTGKPKGVMVPHRAVVQFCSNVVELFSLTGADRVLQFANPAFDVSVSDFFTTFTAGATVVGAPRDTLHDPDKLQALMSDERVSFIDIPPTVLRLLDPEPLTDLRSLFIGMEPFPAELVNRWQRPGREFHNGYGPTEVTITCVDYKCPPEDLDTAPPIGQAMANHRAYVLDRNLRPVPIGVPGELYMAGAGLAHGYLGRPDLTAEKFLPDPFSDQPGERMYATGDLVRWRSDGNLEFLGRVDRQVKIRGLRVELGEIEHVINSVPSVRQCAVTVQAAGSPDVYLVGYLVPEAGEHPDLEAIREYLAQRLPLHMIPTVLITIPELPLTAAGKLDHRRLPAPRADTGDGYAEPATETQRRLATVWRPLLSVERIGARDNFFSLGGNSLQATQLISRIRDNFQVSLDPRQLFTHPTLEQLAKQIDEATQAQLDAAEVAALEAEIAGLSEDEIDKLLDGAG
ncbi:MAG TPA: amino acid adenylation domain-containing protein [Micromonosporaceae bacterium]